MAAAPWAPLNPIYALCIVTMTKRPPGDHSMLFESIAFVAALFVVIGSGKLTRPAP